MEIIVGLLAVALILAVKSIVIFMSGPREPMNSDRLPIKSDRLKNVAWLTMRSTKYRDK